MRTSARRLLVLFLVLVTALAAFPASALAASPKTVRVTVPDFPVHIGGQLIDPSGEEYPFLVYNEITYLPLTYYGCQLLGLYAEWKSPETGLIISDTGSKGPYVSSPRVSSNKGTLTAEVATGKIAIKGRAIDNAAEEWPFLLFRQITYIPMTWANMHDTLGCDYWWNAGTGLWIDRGTNETANVLRLPLADTFGSSVVQAYAGYFWYYDTDKNISRVPMTGGEPELVYDMTELHAHSILPPIPSFYIDNGNLYLLYQAGGSAIMSTQYTLQLHPDGTVTSPTGTNVNPDDGKTYFNGMNGEILETDAYALIAHHYPAETFGNLVIRRSGSDSWEAFGEPGYLYACATNESESGGFSYSFPTHGFLYESNGMIYTLAHNSFAKANPDEYTEDTWYDESWTKYYEPDLVWPQYSRVCSIDPATGETTFLTEYADSLFVEGDTIYYLTAEDHALKACDLDGGNVRTLVGPVHTSYNPFTQTTQTTDAYITQFTVVNGTVYYAVGTTKYLQSAVSTPSGKSETYAYKTGDNPLYVLTKDHGPVRIGTTPLRKMDASEGYLIALLDADSDNPASDPVRLAVYDGETEIYTIRGADVIAAGISDGSLYYVLR